MIVVNTETIPGYQILQIKGLVQGNTVRAKHVGRDIAASFKNLVGGELSGYTELIPSYWSSLAGRPWPGCWHKLSSWVPTRW
jgi:uncharacterized protein YbjQ (UPF0145 family)